MKQRFTYLCIALLCLSISLPAQSVLKYSTHAMQEGDVLTLKTLEAISEGNAGTNQIWDYSNAQIGADYTINYLLDNNTSYPQGKAFACDQNGASTPYYQITSTQKIFYGISGANFAIKLTKPMIELAFPFAYKDQIIGDLEGTYTLGSTAYPLAGEYTITADAWGKLILPNGVEFDKALRVKTDYTYDFDINGIKYKQHSVKYAYYSTSSRYALLQIIITDMECSCGTAYTTTNKVVYFNPSALPGAENIVAQKSLSVGESFTYKVYPNPFENEVNVTYQVKSSEKVKISVLDMMGKEIMVLENSQKEKGEYMTSASFNSTQSQNYILRIQAGERVYTEKLIQKAK